MLNDDDDDDFGGDGYLISRLTDRFRKRFGLDWLLGGGMMTGRLVLLQCGVAGCGRMMDDDCAGIDEMGDGWTGEAGVWR